MNVRRLAVTIGAAGLLYFGSAGGGFAAMEWCAGGCPPPIHAGFREAPKPYQSGLAQGLSHDNPKALSQVIDDKGVFRPATVRNAEK